MNPKKYQSMIKRAIPILLIALVFSLPASADEGQAGLQYWKGIDKEAITTSSGLQY
jgi:hypothetical protein